MRCRQNQISYKHRSVLKKIQTVSIQEPSDRHFDIPDIFSRVFALWQRKRWQTAYFNVWWSYMTTVLEVSNFWLANFFKLSPKISNKFTPFIYIFLVLLLLVCMLSFQTKQKKRTADYLMPEKPLLQIVSPIRFC